MKLLSLKFNETNHNLIINQSDDLDNKYTFFVGGNGAGKTECLIQIINSLLRYQLQNKNIKKHRDILDDFLDNRYKSSLTDFKVTSNLTFEQKNITIEISFEKTDEPREIIGFDGQKITLEHNSYRYYNNVKTSNTSTSNSDKNRINIIAISESPYQKFPVLQSEDFLNYYNIGSHTEENIEYLNHASDDYVNPKIKQLSKSICFALTKDNKSDYSDLFNMLGFNEGIKFTVKVKDSFRYFNQKSEQIAERVVSKRYERSRFSSIAKNTDIEGKKNKAINELVKAINGLHQLAPELSIINITYNSMKNRFSFNIDFQNISLMVDYIKTLIEYDVLYISNIFFQPLRDENRWVDAYRLSSGQLSLLNLIFGISSKIKDDSLILIDEPELSLHPEWQSHIISVIHDSFKKYKCCHFIVATHSPHILSNVVKNNSTIVLIEKSESNNSVNSIINTEYGCQGWTVEEILQDIMGMSDTRTDTYNSLMKLFNQALDNDDLVQSRELFKQISLMLHPNNVQRKILDIQMIGVGEGD